MRDFLDFCRSSFVNNFIVKNHFSGPYNHRNLNISRPIYLTTISAHRFEDDICTNKLEEFFFRKMFFSRTWSFFHDNKTTVLSLTFFPQKIGFIRFFKCDLEKKVKNWWFYSFKSATRTLQTNLNKFF